MTELQVTEIINVINLTVIDQTTTTDYEITEVVETIHLTITEKFGSDGLPGPPGPASTVPGPKGDPGTSITKTSELTNDGEDGVNAFITAQDIPEESLTTIQQPTLAGNILTIKYIGENRTLQEQTVDLSNLATIDIHIEDATYDASTNIITLTDTKGTTFNIDLSEFSILTRTDANGVTILTQEGVTKLTLSKVGQTGSYNDLLNKPAPIDISGKLDKPTTDGTWVVTKSGATISYTDASTLGKNISNSNLVWTADRTQNLGTKKLSFTGGRVSVPALELEITAENSVPNKIWTAGTYLWHTNNLGISYRVAYDNQVIKTISGNITLDDTYHNCIVRITANCVITVPNTLRADFNCVFDVIGLFTAQFVAGGTTTFSAPFGAFLRDNMMCTLYKETSVRFRINGGLTVT